MGFAVSTRKLGSAVSVVRVAGEADLSAAPELKAALAAAIASGAKTVLVDLCEATFVDSTTLGALMGAVKRLRPEGGELAISCSDPNIRRVFEITLLDRVFRIFPTPGEGLDHLLESSNGSTTTTA